MALVRVSSSGLAYPGRFFAAASYAGFEGSPTSSSKIASSKFPNDVALLLYALYQQASVGPCTIPKPRGWNPVEQTKWTSWHGLGNMTSTEAMRLFVKILEEEDPGWYSRASNFDAEPVVDVDINHHLKDETVVSNGGFPIETKVIPAENGTLMEIVDKDVVLEGLDSVNSYDQWVAPPVSGPRPRARYEHGAAVIDDKMYIFGGNHNGRYIHDLQVLDLRNWIWSRVDVKVASETVESPSPVPIVPCCGHSLIPWGTGKLISVAGHTKVPSETITVKKFELQSCTWSDLKTYGKPPVSRGGQSATLVGSSLVIFGGQDANRTLLNDLHILDLETMTWDEIDAVGVPPSPRSDHAAAVHAERYLFIFGGSSYASCFNDLHVLDLQAMEWSRPIQHGDIPTPRAGHAGVAVGENWFIVGGGDNRSAVSETVVLNMSTLVWSAVTTVEGHTPLASEGLSVVLNSYNDDDFLISFGGYNGRYNNVVNVLKPSIKSTLPVKSVKSLESGNVSAVHVATTNFGESEIGTGQEGKVREIVMNYINLEPMITSEESTEEVLATLKADKVELESSLGKEKMQSLLLKQELAEAEAKNTELYKELQTVRGQLAAEQSRCFKLEVGLAEVRQKLQSMETLEKELELLRRQKAASELAAVNAKQRQKSGGVWGWLAPPPNQKTDNA